MSVIKSCLWNSIYLDVTVRAENDNRNKQVCLFYISDLCISNHLPVVIVEETVVSMTSQWSSLFHLTDWQQHILWFSSSLSCRLKVLNQNTWRRREDGVWHVMRTVWLRPTRVFDLRKLLHFCKTDELPFTLQSTRRRQGAGFAVGQLVSFSVTWPLCLSCSLIWVHTQIAGQKLVMHQAGKAEGFLCDLNQRKLSSKKPPCASLHLLEDGRQRVLCSRWRGSVSS